MGPGALAVTALAIRHDQNWLAFAIVIGVLVVGYLWDSAARHQEAGES